MVKLRNVYEKDCKLLFEWANDELVRKNSFNTDKINYEEHINWFSKKLNSKDTLMYILCNDNIDIGIIRVDIKNEIGDISYSVNKNFRGKGYSVKLIRLLEEIVMQNDFKFYKLTAYVKYENIVSQKVFEKLNYIRKNNDKSIEYYKIIYRG